MTTFGSNTAIRSLVQAAEQEQAEIVVFGLRNIASDGTVTARYVPQVGTRTYRGAEVLEDFLPEFINPDPHGDGRILFYLSSCVLMYSMEKIRHTGWQYVSERKIISEDVYSLLNLFDTIHTVTVVPQDYYCYCMNNNTSFSRKYTPNRYEKIKYFYLETVRLCERKMYSENIVKRVAGPFLGYTIATLKQEAKAPVSFMERKDKVYEILSDPVLQQVVQQYQGVNQAWTRKLLFFLIRRKCYFACYLLLMFRE